MRASEQIRMSRFCPKVRVAHNKVVHNGRMERATRRRHLQEADHVEALALRLGEPRRCMAMFSRMLDTCVCTYEMMDDYIRMLGAIRARARVRTKSKWYSGPEPENIGL